MLGRSLFGSLAAGMHALTFVFFFNPSINALCHWPHKWLGGYQNSRAAHAFRTSNNWVVALLTAGEGFHNNHHDQAGKREVRLDRMGIGRGLGLLGRHRAAPLARARHECASAQTGAGINTECTIRIEVSRRTASDDNARSPERDQRAWRRKHVHVASALRVELVCPDLLRPNRTILIMDDDPQVRRLMKRTLEGVGYLVLEADSGATAASVSSNTRAGSTCSSPISSCPVPTDSWQAHGSCERGRR